MLLSLNFPSRCSANEKQQLDRVWDWSPVMSRAGVALAASSIGLWRDSVYLNMCPWEIEVLLSLSWLLLIKQKLSTFKCGPLLEWKICSVTLALWSLQLSLLVFTGETNNFDWLPKAETIYSVINSEIHAYVSSFPSSWPNCSFTTVHWSFLSCNGMILFATDLCTFWDLKGIKKAC